MIYILHESPIECDKLLDDKALGKMISAIARVLSNVCYWSLNYGQYSETPSKHYKDDVPLKPDVRKDLYQWSQWARTCRANYQRLLEYAMACCKEWIYRFNDGISFEDSCKFFSLPLDILKLHKLHYVIAWCDDNVPELPVLCTHNGGYLKYKPYDPEHPCTCDDHTPFPLVPDKYIKEGVYMPLRDGDTTTALCYRAYYKAKLRKKLKKCDCFSLPCELSKCICVAWTNRSVPDFLWDL